MSGWPRRSAGGGSSSLATPTFYNPAADMAVAVPNTLQAIDGAHLRIQWALTAVTNVVVILSGTPEPDNGVNREATRWGLLDHGTANQRGDLYHVSQFIEAGGTNKTYRPKVTQRVIMLGLAAGAYDVDWAHIATGPGCTFHGGGFFGPVTMEVFSY